MFIINISFYFYFCLLLFFLQIIGALELFGLTIIAIGLGLKMRWMGLKQFVLHKRTAFKVSNVKQLGQSSCVFQSNHLPGYIHIQ